MLNLTKTVNYLVIRTAQHTDTKLMNLCENFRQNLLVKSYLMKDFSFLTDKLKHRKVLVWGLL